MLKPHLNNADAVAADSDNSAPIVLHAPAINPAPARERRHTEFFDVASSSLAIKTSEQFCAWAQDDLQHIFPHGMMACGIGLIENSGIRIQHLITHNFPHEYIQTLQQSNGLTTSPILAQWIETRRPVLFEMVEKHRESMWLQNFKRYGLHNAAAHGQCDMHSRATSYFGFTKIPGKLTSRHADLLEMLAPHLHAALVRVVDNINKEPHKSTAYPHGLTEREYQVLQWLGSGKTNWEIAQILHVSENTIKNHVQRILSKLKVNTRAQAAVQGLSFGHKHQMHHTQPEY